MSQWELRVSVLLILLAHYLLGFSQELRINELMIHNTSVPTENNEYAPWIEFKNNSSKSISLTDYSIKSKDHAYIIQLGADSVSPNSVSIVWLLPSKYSEELITRLKSDSSKLLLVRNSNALFEDSVRLDALTTNESYGRRPDGTKEFIVYSNDQITPGEENPSPGVWSKIRSYTEFRRGDSGAFGCLTFNDKIWILDYEAKDENGNWVDLAEVWESLDGYTWKLVNKSPPYSHNSTFTVFEGYMWAFDGNCYRSKDGIAWELLGQNTVAKSGRVTPFNGELWFNTRSSIYKSKNGYTWETAVEKVPWIPRTDAAFMVHNNRLFMFGGAINYGSFGFEMYFQDVWSSSDGVNWDLVLYSAPWKGGVWCTYATFDDRIWRIGGYNFGNINNGNQGNTNEVWSSLDGRNWDRVNDSDMWNSRHAPFTWVFKDELLLAAGYNNYTLLGLYNDVWKYTRIQQDITAENVSMTYGDLFVSEFSTTSGLPLIMEASDTESVEFSGDTIIAKKASRTTLSVRQVGDSLYKPATKIIQLSIDKKNLFVGVQDMSKEFGETITTPYELNFQGFVNNDSKEYLDSIPYAYSEVDFATPVGEYEIVLLGGHDKNYNYVFKTGKFEVNSSKENFIAYPNPTTSFLTIATSTRQEEVRLRIFSSDGKVVLDELTPLLQPTNLDVSGLSSGVYYVRVEGTQVFKAIRFVKF